MVASTNRITGLATGLDIDSIVKSSMQAYQNKIDKVYKQKSIAEIKQQLYQDVIKDGKQFYSDFLDLTKSGNVVTSSAFKSISFLSSDESVATAVGGADAIKNNYQISVKQKADAARVQIKTDDLFEYDSADKTYKLKSSIRISDGSKDSSGNYITKDDFDNQKFTSVDQAVKYLNKTIAGNGFKAYTSDFSSGNVIFETTETGADKKIEIQSGVVGLSLKAEDSTNPIKDSITIDELLTKDSNGKYSNCQDFQITKDNKEYVIKADQFRNAISTYYNSNDAMTTKYNPTETTVTSDDGTQSTAFLLTSDDKEGLSSLNTYLNAKKAELSKKYDETKSDDDKKNLDDCETNINTIAGILNELNSKDNNGVTISSDQKTLFGDENSGLIKEAIEYNNSKINESINNVLKTNLGENTDVTVSIDASGNVSFNNATYQIGQACYETSSSDTPKSAQGKALKATVTNTATGEAITYTDNPTGDNQKLSNSNTISVDGTVITINSAGTDGSPAVTNLTAKTDVTELKDKIVKFVNGYNEYVTKLNTLLTEKKYRDYEPLTDDQKSEMKDSEIEAWEKKVKSGQLRGDSDLQRIVDNMQSAMMNSVSGAGITLKDMGISLVESYGTTKDGTYTIDEDKLTSALENNTEEVANLFTSKGGTDATNGIAYRLKSICEDEFVYSSKSLLIQKAGYEGTKYNTSSTLSKQIEEYKNKLDDLKDWFDDKEQALYSKWANIETIMNNYNSQASYLSSMFSSGN